MKYKLTVYVLASIFITALISSCSSSNNVVSNSLFQKRKYSKGWHSNKKLSSNKSTKIIQSDEITSDKPLKNEIPLVKQKELKLIITNETVQLPSDKKELILVRDDAVGEHLELDTQPLFNSNGCSKIIRKNGEKIEAIILEVGENYINYKMCGDENGRSYLIPKSSVFRIKYANGDSEVFNEEGKSEEGKPIESKTDSGFYGETKQKVPIGGVLIIIAVAILAIVSIAKILNITPF